MEQSQFTEVVTLLVLVDNPWELVGSLFLLSDQITLKNDIELVSAFSLLNHILAILKLLLLEHIVELLPEIRIKSTFRGN
jgi:hypothetical protein